MNSFLLKYVLIALMGMGLSLKAQPPINQWYDFGRTQSVLGSVYSTDSCYYAIGIAASDVTPGVFDGVFTKIDLNGNVVIQKFIHSDTCWISTFGWTNIEPTYDNNFLALADFDENFLLIKYSPYGDTIWTSNINEIYLNTGFLSVRPAEILEVGSDSSVTCIMTIQHEVTNECRVALVNISKEGSLNFYKTYSINSPGFEIAYASNIIELSDGYLLSCYIFKIGATNADDRHHVRLIKVDEFGNEIWRWTDTDKLLDTQPFGLHQTADNGYLYGGQTGWYYAPLNTHHYSAHIVKLNDDLSLDWEIKMSDSTGISYTIFTDIEEISNSEYVATGHTAKDSMTVGWLINFNIDGEVIWDSYFSLVPANTPDLPRHEFYDLVKTPDNGFAMVGKARDVEATNAGLPGSFGWLVKTDSVGCLVPGCQDFLKADEISGPQINLSLYPNPANNILNVYFNDPSFSGKAIMQVYDFQGKVVKEWPLHSSDITYMYDVSTLMTGTYFLKVVENGVEKGVSKFVKE